MRKEIEEQFIRELMSKSAEIMPFADFEERLMQQIHKEAKAPHSFRKDIKLSWFFFVVGTIFGLFLNVIVMTMDKAILGLPAQRLILVVQALFVIFLLLQFDRLIALTKKVGNPNKGS